VTCPGNSIVASGIDNSGVGIQRPRRILVPAPLDVDALVAWSVDDEPLDPQSARGHALDQLLEALQFGIDLAMGAGGRDLEAGPEDGRSGALGDLHAQPLPSQRGAPASTMACQFSRSTGSLGEPQ